MDEPLRQFVRTRADNLCEYCRLPQHCYPARFHVEHIRARSHQGSNDSDNLALACPRCNRQKGTNLSAYDPATEQLVPLFNPRTDLWKEHFSFRDEWIHGLTDKGRATITLLRMNEEQRLLLRRHLLERGEIV